MFEVVLLSILFFIAPALLGQIRHVQSVPRKSVWYYRRYLQFIALSTRDYSMLLFIACAASLYALFVLVKLGVEIAPNTAIIVAIATVAAALWYLYCYFQKPIKAIRDNFPWKTLLGLTAVAIAALSKIFSDQMIAEVTHLPARDLPGAQLILALYFTPTLWFVGFSLTMGFTVVFLSIFLQVYTIARDYLSMRKKQKYNGTPDMVAVIALFLGAVLALVLTQKLISEKTYGVPVRQAIVFAAFHLPPSYCGLPDIEGAKVTPLQDGVGAIALPDKQLGYRFEQLECKPKPKNLEEVLAITQALRG